MAWPALTYSFLSLQSDGQEVEKGRPFLPVMSTAAVPDRHLVRISAMEPFGVNSFLHTSMDSKSPPEPFDRAVGLAQKFALGFFQWRIDYRDSIGADKAELKRWQGRSSWRGLSRETSFREGSHFELAVLKTDFEIMGDTEPST